MFHTLQSQQNLFLSNKRVEYLYASDLMLVDPFNVGYRDIPSDSAFRTCYDSSPFVPCLFVYHGVTLGGITMLRRTILQKSNYFFSSPFDPLYSGLSCVTKGRTLLYGVSPNVFSDIHFASLTLFFHVSSVLHLSIHALSKSSNT